MKQNATSSFDIDTGSVTLSLISIKLTQINVILNQTSCSKVQKGTMTTTTVTTDKKRISLYVEQELKTALEALAKAKKRSLSNLIEVLCQEAVDKAKQKREI